MLVLWCPMTGARVQHSGKETQVPDVWVPKQNKGFFTRTQQGDFEVMEAKEPPSREGGGNHAGELQLSAQTAKDVRLAG